MTRKIIVYAAIGIGSACAGMFVGKIDDHVRATQWGYVWELEPAPDWPADRPMDQLVRCPGGELTLPPWHVRVVWDDNWSKLPPAKWWFWQERGS